MCYIGVGAWNARNVAQTMNVIRLKVTGTVGIRQSDPIELTEPGCIEQMERLRQRVTEWLDSGPLEFVDIDLGLERKLDEHWSQSFIIKSVRAEDAE